MKLKIKLQRQQENHACDGLRTPYLSPPPEVLSESKRKTKINEKGFLCVKITAKNLSSFLSHGRDKCLRRTQYMNETTYIAEHNGSVQQTTIYTYTYLVYSIHYGV